MLFFTGTLKGGYVAIKETGPLERIILSAGSELQWACDAAKELGMFLSCCDERFSYYAL